MPAHPKKAMGRRFPVCKPPYVWLAEMATSSVANFFTLWTEGNAGRNGRKEFWKERVRIHGFSSASLLRKPKRGGAAYSVSSLEEEARAHAHTITSLKVNLLAMVVGLDRGLLARETDVVKVNTVAGSLENVGGPVRLGEGEGLLQGRWRLIYSSAFASGSLGGRRPGPPVGLLPLTLGQVYQRIDVLARELDNIVELRISTPWPLPVLEVTATLAHTFVVIGENNVKITFERTSVKFGGGVSQLPPFDLPQLLPDFPNSSPSLRSGSFECTYLDDSMRITRGDRGELRVFVMA